MPLLSQTAADPGRRLVDTKPSSKDDGLLQGQPPRSWTLEPRTLGVLGQENHQAVIAPLSEACPKTVSSSVARPWQTASLQMPRTVPRVWSSDVDIEANKAALRRIFDELINKRKLDLAHELYAAEHELHPASPEVTRGPEGMKRAFVGLHEEFPDIHVTVESIVAEGDMVAVRLTFKGTHVQSGPTVWPEMVFTRFKDGKAVESWEVTDTGRSGDDPPW